MNPLENLYDHNNKLKPKYADMRAQYNNKNTLCKSKSTSKHPPKIQQRSTHLKPIIDLNPKMIRRGFKQIRELCKNSSDISEDIVITSTGQTLVNFCLSYILLNKKS